MKITASFIVLLSVLSACSSSDNSGIVQNGIDTIVVYKYDTISDCMPYASIDGVYSGKISKLQLIKAKEIKLLNNNKKYQILSFRFSHKSGFVDNQISNLGPVFNSEIGNVFEGLQAASVVCFENIRAFDKNNDTVVLNSIVLHLPG